MSSLSHNRGGSTQVPLTWTPKWPIQNNPWLGLGSPFGSSGDPWWPFHVVATLSAGCVWGGGLSLHLWHSTEHFTIFHITASAIKVRKSTLYQRLVIQEKWNSLTSPICRCHLRCEAASRPSPVPGPLPVPGATDQHGGMGVRYLSIHQFQDSPVTWLHKAASEGLRKTELKYKVILKPLVEKNPCTFYSLCQFLINFLTIPPMLHGGTTWGDSREWQISFTRVRVMFQTKESLKADKPVPSPKLKACLRSP